MVRRALRIGTWLVTLALVLYHVWLFAGRVRAASFTPEVSLRWMLAAALLGLALAFRRRGLSILRGRPAIVFWVLALLLHLGPLPMPAISEPDASLLSLLPWGLAATLAAALLVSRRAARVKAPRWASVAALSVTQFRRQAVPALALRFSPRPPPAA